MMNHREAQPDLHGDTERPTNATEHREAVLNNPTRLRKLRIAWSVVWGTGCLLVIVLWARSYWWIDWLSHLTSTGYANVASAQGRLGIWYDRPPPANIAALIAKGWHFNVSPMPVPPGVKWNWSPSVNVVWISYWLMITVGAALGFAPWMRWSKRFSLRTLLIVTTLIAVAFGLAIYATRK
jgi:hypothetical protein